VKRLHPLAVFSLLALGLLTGRPADEPPAPPGDDDIRQKVVGTWIVDINSSTGVSIKGTVRILSDGSFISKATASLRGEKLEIDYEGTWRVKGGYLIETITKSDSELARVGKVTSDKILRVDDHELSYEMVGGKMVTRKRLE
jgi:hypothetical protein